LLVKFDNNLTLDQADKILEKSTLSGNEQKWIEEPTTESTPNSSDCSISWKYGWNCLLPTASNWATGDNTYADYTLYMGAGVVSGVVDGLLGTLEGFFNSGQKIGNIVENVWSSIYNFAEETIRNGIDLEALKRATYSAVSKTWSSFKNFLEDVRLLANSIYKNFNYANLVEMVQSFLGVIICQLSEISAENATKFVSYSAGLVAFSILASYFTGGIATIAKTVSKADKFVEFIDVLNKGFGKAGEWLGNKISGSKFKSICATKIGGCFVKDTPILMAENNPFKVPALAYSLAALPLIYPIQNVQPDDIVKAYHHEQSYYATADNNDDVFVPGWQDYDYENITPETWQIGTFEIIEPTGSKVEVEANRPKTWYSENNVNAIGDRTWFYMPEIGINGEATLLSLRPTVINTTHFPLNQSGQVDRPVITTFKRFAPVVYDYHFSDGSIIGATPEHPFFSIDRNNYIAVGELQLGEQVMTAGQNVVKFIAGKQRDRGEPVYNFEVWREHNYYVGSKESGEFLLVHNECDLKKLLKDV
jgi:hypothetical protein